MTTELDTQSLEVDEPEMAGGGGASAGEKRFEELGRIIMAYSEVTERLQKSHEQLTQTVQKLQLELGEKNRQLERRNRLAALGEMAAGMAHEIRNPLGAIQLYASMLASDVKGMPESARVVEKISGGVRRLEDIVSKVLHFSRDLRVNPLEGDLSQLVAECVELAGPRASVRRITLVAEGPESVTAKFDRIMMSQAVLNLIHNGIDASPEGGSVVVGWGEEVGGGEMGAGRRLRFVRVRDSGCGVAAEAMDRIFNPFFTTKDEGTGLGLSIVHRVVEAHEGTITVRNDGGAVFEVRW